MNYFIIEKCKRQPLILKQILSSYIEDCTYTMEEIQTAICIIDSNTYHVLVRSGPTLQDFVCGVYTRAAMVNHSCRPNTRPIFHGKQERAMNVVAIDDISAGQEISTSYLEPFYTTLQRRALLKRGKLFGCSCKRYFSSKTNIFNFTLIISPRFTLVLFN